MPWVSGAIIGGSAIVGDLMSQSGQQSTNAMNMAMMQQSEQWQKQMSDTQMQRRVADLKAAGLNPMLATGTPGASMGSPVMPSLQNPASAFGQLGSQASSAVQLESQQSQIDVNKAQASLSSAQADKARVDAQKAAGVDTAAQQQGILESQSRVALNSVQGDAQKAQASLSSAQAAVAQATLPKIQAEISNIWSQRDLNSAKANVEQLQSMIQDLDIQQRTAIMPSIIESAQYAARSAQLAIPEQYALADFFSSSIGGNVPAVQQLLKVAIGALHVGSR